MRMIKKNNKIFIIKKAKTKPRLEAFRRAIEKLCAEAKKEKENK